MTDVDLLNELKRWNDSHRWHSDSLVDNQCQLFERVEAALRRFMKRDEGHDRELQTARNDALPNIHAKLRAADRMAKAIDEAVSFSGPENVSFRSAIADARREYGEL